MSKNRLSKHPRTVTDERAREIVGVLLTHFGPMESYKLLNLSLLMANDISRRCIAGIDVRRVTKNAGLGQFGWRHLVCEMLIDGLIENVGETTTLKVVMPHCIDGDDAERIREIEMIPPRFAIGLGLRSGD